MKITNNQMILLSLISERPQTVYAMSQGDPAVLTGMTQMGIHKICKALEELGLITSKEVKKPKSATAYTKVITKEGKKVLESLKQEPFNGLPRCWSDEYILDHIKNGNSVHEELVIRMVHAKNETKLTDAKQHLSDAIRKYQAV